MGWGMGIPIGWPNATYQQGVSNLTAYIPASEYFNIPKDQYTIEWWGVITPHYTNEQTFWSFGEDLDTHSFSVLKDPGGEFDYKLLYIINGVDIFGSPIVTLDLETVDTFQFFTIERSGGKIYMFFNGVEVTLSIYPSAISSGGFNLYIGSNNQSAHRLYGGISNFRFSQSAVYSTGGFTPPASPLTVMVSTVCLVCQGETLNELIMDQGPYGFDIVPGQYATSVIGDPFGEDLHNLNFNLPANIFDIYDCSNSATVFSSSTGFNVGNYIYQNATMSYPIIGYWNGINYGETMNEVVTGLITANISNC